MPIRFAADELRREVGHHHGHERRSDRAEERAVSGNAPPGKLAVTGSTCIGGVKECCLGERTIADLQRRRLQAPRHERRLQAPEQALEADQQPVPGRPAPRVVPERADPLQGDGEMPAGVRARHHKRRSGDAGEDPRRHGVHHPTPLRLQQVLRRLPQGLLRQAPLQLLQPAEPSTAAVTTKERTTRSTTVAIMTTKTDRLTLTRK